MLGMQKSTVSRRIAQLEERLGVRLLNRTTRKLRLTEVGEAYYERCRQIMQEFAEAEEAIMQLQSEPTGLLRITSTIEFGQLLLGAVVGEFVGRYPNLQVDVELTSRHIDPVEEGVDIARSEERRVGKEWRCRRRRWCFQAEDGIRAADVTGVQTCALPICDHAAAERAHRIAADYLDHRIRPAAARCRGWRVRGPLSQPAGGCGAYQSPYRPGGGGRGYRHPAGAAPGFQPGGAAAAAQSATAVRQSRLSGGVRRAEAAGGSEPSSLHPDPDRRGPQVAVCRTLRERSGTPCGYGEQHHLRPGGGRSRRRNHQRAVLHRPAAGGRGKALPGAGRLRAAIHPALCPVPLPSLPVDEGQDLYRLSSGEAGAAGQGQGRDHR